MPDYAEIIFKINIVVPLVISNISSKCESLYDFFDLFLPFLDRYFFIQRSFSLDFYAKNGSVSGC